MFDVCGNNATSSFYNSFVINMCNGFETAGGRVTPIRTLNACL